MSIHITRAKNLASSLRQVGQTSRGAFRKFSTDPFPPMGDKISRLKSTLNHEKTFEYSHKQLSFGLITAAVIGTTVSGYWIMKALDEDPAVIALKITDPIAEKQGVLWDCIGRDPDEYGGYIYHYKLKEKYDDDSYQVRKGDMTSDAHYRSLYRKRRKIDLKNSEIFPAIEPSGSGVVYALLYPIWQNLGYSYKNDKSGFYLSLPDKEALEARFEKLRETRPGLQPLKIASSEGVADDLSFIEAYLKFDVLLSSSKEFVHDHFFHVMRTIDLMLFEPSYPDERQRIREIVSKVLLSIKIAEEEIDKNKLTDLKGDLDKIITAVGAEVDDVWATSEIGNLKRINYHSFVHNFQEVLNRGRFQLFTLKKFGKKIERSTLADLWGQIRTLEKNHKVAQKT